ncbi:hypothetical protein RHSIM_Rhsim12G0160700 [Rhododendron simsii]|uniref:Uncharacterized protein n=1 Tax=Rhododendron simsii TaxID=118357 RepID=A0A834L995_RHOSS|nr:hypothetical protein RHSIM_Rhsim12G0160700 [Rhododendron simsii]
MGVASKTGEWAFKAFTAGLGVATIYLAATFSVNVYRGLSWHNAQSFEMENSIEGAIIRADKYSRFIRLLLSLICTPLVILVSLEIKERSSFEADGEESDFR